MASARRPGPDFAMPTDHDTANARRRELARSIYAETMAACTVPAAVHRHVRVSADGVLEIQGATWDLRSFNDILIVSIGKAGATLYDSLCSLLPTDLRVRAVVDAPAPPSRRCGDMRFFRGGHPLPNEDSLAAARAALEMLGSATQQTLALFLVSGGASGMFEAPIDSALTLDDLIETHRILVGSGLSIAEMNTIRKRLSAVKGGRLAVAAGAATKVTLLVSDVPAQALDSLASGPTLPDTSTNEDCRKLLRERLNIASFPAAVRKLLTEHMEETPKAEHEVFQNSASFVLLDSDAMLAEAERAVRRLGFHSVVDNTCDDWPYEDAARYLCDRWQELQRQDPRACLLSAGEVTVELPPHPGTGGRNQQWALEMARLLAERGLSATVLSAGSDGIDGKSPAAGAVADSTTWSRVQQAGVDPAARLAAFDAYAVFSALGDAIVTGPSGNNLRDLRILLPAEG